MRAPLLLLAGLTLAACRSTTEPQDTAAASASASAPASASASASVLTYVDPPVEKGATSPNLVPAGDGALFTWIEPAAEGPKKGGRVRLARFAGGAWGEATTVVTSERLLVNWADVPVAAEGGGNIVAAFPERAGQEGYFAVLTASGDDGKTWKRIGPMHTDRSETDHGFVSLIPHGEGVRAFWLDGRATAGGPETTPGSMALYTTFVGSQPSNETLLDGRVCDCCGIAAASRTWGPMVAYRDRSEDEVRDINVVILGHETFPDPMRVRPDGFRIEGCPVNGPALVADGERAALAWFTYADAIARVKVAFSDNGGMSFDRPIEIAGRQGAEAPIGRVSVVLLPDGDAIVGYVVAKAEEAHLVVRRVSRKGAVGAPLVLASMRADRTSGFPKMVRLGDTLLFAFSEGSSPRLRAARLPVAAVPAPPAQSQADKAAPGADEKLARVGDIVPSFELMTLEEKHTLLAGLKGKPVLVNLWATDCEPCKRELPTLARLHRTYGPRGLEVVGISMDQGKSISEIKAFVARRKVPYRTWIDRHAHTRRAFGVETLPATFLIDAQGKIVLVRSGVVHENDAELAAAIEKTLGPAK
ncbi:TlpA family protein disulfide reductase [Polyangium mundeleinium]|uniref:TlpA disulfide reductase family protein n=1 Tax=Polyangium mundeleinium TaxID=2995306 RepID=A0ABT5ELV0_9BACT|nr:TlpA disulfide reductase family protein [Polyangium mundeleinium]MDC0742798.1 TlpA disulfide reductase family protein [Polyangium mundeleinium]